jgi:purine-nucleoside phosphorylase
MTFANFHLDIHDYEGYTPSQVTLPIRIMKKLGISTLLGTNAAGGINETFIPGDFMMIADRL